ncbi:MAG TPA: aldolase/citrate lyase family protein [Candidatus Krumholzibacteria bacterium]|nr:aldolase/citrate lyase family protein [Candidatus Krumholzibacteria bacterium]HPD71892.1 aldolase/citrate lyase family protein [Candidatus Krumholzibacteria bacterium]HRY41175.1 aldolase/citrate lyase family protein [Candidatus Krumholzibacteria bacterium]
MAARGEAGDRGPKVRSDCWIAVEIREAGGVEIALESKVAGLYGQSIRTLVAGGCRALGVAHAGIEIVDQGALPFTLAARLETAVKRALPDCAAEFLLPMADRCRYASRRDRLRRTRLYLPGTQPKLFVNAGLHEPDGVILDLEDAVAPSEKDAARALVRNALRAVDFRGAERMVRINQGELGLADLDWIAPHNVHLVLIPKVESPEQVVAVAEKLGRLVPAREVFLMPIVESALGAWRAYEIATAHPSVVALSIGLEDYTADIGTQRTLQGTESFWARSQVLNGARAAGVQPIDTVFSDVTDMEGLRQSVLEARALGYVGKGCIHPRQIPVVHDALAPSAAEIDKALKIVRAFEDAQRRGVGVVALGSKMIDAPVVRRAVTTVETAVLVGRLRADWRDAEVRG